jgi:hypothetical protein
MYHRAHGLDDVPPHSVVVPAPIRGRPTRGVRRSSQSLTSMIGHAGGRVGGEASTTSASRAGRGLGSTSVDPRFASALGDPRPGWHRDCRSLGRTGGCFSATVSTSGHHGRAVRTLSSLRAGDERRQLDQPESDVRRPDRPSRRECGAPRVLDGPAPSRGLHSRDRPRADCRRGTRVARQLRRRVRGIPSVSATVAGSSIGHRRSIGTALVGGARAPSVLQASCLGRQQRVHVARRTADGGRARASSAGHRAAIDC